MYPVRMTVMLDGKPLEGAEVSLEPAQKTADAKTVSGVTDAEGTVRFKTAAKQQEEKKESEEKEGVLPGTYVVLISKKIEEKRISNNEIRALAEKGIRYRPEIIETVPEKYTRRDTSPLQIKVGYWQPKEFSFVLDPAGKVR